MLELTIMDCILLNKILFVLSQNLGISEEIMHLHLLGSTNTRTNSIKAIKTREHYHIFRIEEPENWTNAYNDQVFFELYRMKKSTFQKLLSVVHSNDQHSLIKKKYRGGNKPVKSEKALLIFSWYMSKQDTLNSISETFRLVPSTVMQVINNLLYILSLV